MFNGINSALKNAEFSQIFTLQLFKNLLQLTQLILMNRHQVTSNIRLQKKQRQRDNLVCKLFVGLGTYWSI